MTFARPAHPRPLGLNPDENEEGEPPEDLPDPRFESNLITPVDRAEYEAWLDEQAAKAPEQEEPL